ncbi:hypothetical protein RQP46_009927 [Phenoliferia psychrophenolica]
MAHEAEQGSFSASFVYGIQVNAHDLIQRAKAFSTYSTDAHALNLIISRRRRSAPVLSILSPPPNASITTLPLSILLLIRAQLLKIHIDATPHLLFDEHVNYFESNEDFPRLARDFDLDASWPGAAAEGDGSISGTKFKAGADIEDSLPPSGDTVDGKEELASRKVRPAFMLLQSAIAPLGWGWRHDAEDS